MHTLQTVPTIYDLRIFSINLSDDVTVIVQGYNFPGDGGGGTFIYKKIVPSDTHIPYPNMDGHTVPHEDNGVFFNSWVSHMGAEVGLWIRQFSGYIDVRFYNVMGGGADFTFQIQAAIDYAAKSVEDVNSRPFGYNNSNTVFVPNGQYSISTLILRTGISLIGASLKNTTIISVNDYNDYMLKSDVGVIRDLHISNFTFIGDAAEFTSSNQIFKGCMLFKAQPGYNDLGGGVWESSIKNILIIQFTGHSINFEGGGASTIVNGQQRDYQYNLPNQFITMEGVQVESVGQLVAKAGLENFKNQYNALRITGQNGQFSFTNCRFDGGSYLHVELPDTAYKLNGTNVYIGQFLPGNTQVVSPSIINFNTCTFQMGENAFLMDSCNNIKIDGCFFESFERSIIIKGRDKSSKSINILNNSFLYAAGRFGTLPPDSGRIIIAQNSQVNVHNNFIFDNFDETIKFIAADTVIEGGIEVPAKNIGINASGNYFDKKALGNSEGIKKNIDISTLSVTNPTLIDIESSKTIDLINKSGVIKEINEIVSCSSAGEYIFIRASQGIIRFTEANNIYLGRMALELTHGESALFIKIDGEIYKNPPITGKLFYESYNLVCFLPVI